LCSIRLKSRRSGLRADSTLGPGLINLDISGSISNNAGNGINLIGSAGGAQNMLNLSHSTIAAAVVPQHPLLPGRNTERFR
jgi:hypothetical protein